MNYYIVTFSKVHHKITEEQLEQINSSKSSDFEINGSLVKQNNIADILTEKKYFETYPEKREEAPRDDFQRNYSEFNKQIRKPTGKARELMKKGFLDATIGLGYSKEEAEKKFVEYIDSGVSTYWQDVVEKYKDKQRNQSEEEHYQFALTKI